VVLLGDASAPAVAGGGGAGQAGDEDRGEHGAELAHEGDAHRRSHEGLGAHALQGQEYLEAEGHAREGPGEDDDDERLEADEIDASGEPAELERGYEDEGRGVPEKPAEPSERADDVEGEIPQRSDPARRWRQSARHRR